MDWYFVSFPYLNGISLQKDFDTASTKISKKCKIFQKNPKILSFSQKHPLFSACRALFIARCSSRYLEKYLAFTQLKFRVKCTMIRHINIAPPPLWKNSNVSKGIFVLNNAVTAWLTNRISSIGFRILSIIFLFINLSCLTAVSLWLAKPKDSNNLQHFSCFTIRQTASG